MRKNKSLILVRYISLFSILFSLTASTELLSVNTTILFLILLINSQIRFFSLNRPPFIICSILLDLVLLLLMPHSLALYFILPVIDSLLLLSQKDYLFPLLFVIFSLIIYRPKILNSMNLPALFSLFIIGGLCLYIKEEHEKKLDAQILYDELRISEEKLKQAKEELELYATSMTELAVLKERNRISRDIHDSVGHALSTAMIQLNAMEVIASKEQSSVAPLATNLREFLKECLQEVRVAIAKLKPSEYKTYQEFYRIEELIQNFEKLSGVMVRMSVSSYKWSLSPKIGLTLYRIIQEALSNALRHGQATEVKINLNFSPETLSLIIENNGAPCQTIKKGVGLTSMSERIHELNGKIFFPSSVNGFKIQVILPKEKENEING